MLNFGIGGVYAIPSGANPTPVQVAVLDGVDIDFAYDIKKKRGQFQIPVAVGRAGLDILVKAKFADIRAATLAMVLAGSTSAVGHKRDVAKEPGSGPIPSTPFQLTVANGGTFFEDANVYDVTAGLWMTRGATATGAGVYAVNTATGVYTFNTADQGHLVEFYYSYTVSASGKTTTLNNAVMGLSTPFAFRAWDEFGAKKLGVRIPAVHFPKLSLAFKSEDFTEHNLEGFVSQDTASSKVLDIDTWE